MKRAWRPAAAFALAVASCGVPAFAQEGGTAPQPGATPQPERAVRDPDFGVAARHLGLERRVEMYQWHAAGQGYARGWNEQPLDSSGFAPGHDNPPFPLQGRRWLPGSVSVDGAPLAAQVLERLGQWRDFRPSFNALPGNLAATFQPEGDGLGSAENPLDPQVGDLRIRWRELVLPPLQDRIVLRDGRWQLRNDAAPIAVAGTGKAVAGTSAARARGTGRAWWWLGGGALALLLGALLAVRRRRGNRQDKA
ncbi:TMEM43 family protein [Luteimonas sp. 50]|uniref:TMEM43 family protein n=1 Tax=Cognatiluteimonas sedimenti TaxID=2927791 RepID=A0ABT0A4R5_9GAMM|nr:TMEM43 family protein [Lysobacter sedimenti]MCJ0825975.1 TMEM43 family protein [Lysobacter sedimenti]